MAESELTYAEVLEQTITAWEQFRDTIAEILVPVFEQMVKVIAEFYEVCQRVELTHRLNRVKWLSPGVVEWLVDHWPKRWLPEPRFEEWEEREENGQGV